MRNKLRVKIPIRVTSDEFVDFHAEFTEKQARTYIARGIDSAGLGEFGRIVRFALEAKLNSEENNR